MAKKQASTTEPGIASAELLPPQPGNIATLPDTQLRDLGVDCIRAVIGAASLYLRLCQYVRQKGLAKDTVRVSLQAAGFAASRISEVWRVSQAPQEVFDKFASGCMGFKKTIDAARVAQLGYETGELPLQSEAEPAKEKVSLKVRIDKAADHLLHLLAQRSKRKPYTVVKHGMRLSVTKGADNDGAVE